MADCFPSAATCSPLLDPLSLKNRSRIFADDMFQSTDSYIIIGIKEKCRKFF